MLSLHDLVGRCGTPIPGSDECSGAGFKRKGARPSARHKHKLTIRQSSAEAPWQAYFEKAPLQHVGVPGDSARMGRHYTRDWRRSYVSARWSRGLTGDQSEGCRRQRGSDPKSNALTFRGLAGSARCAAHRELSAHLAPKASRRSPMPARRRRCPREDLRQKVGIRCQGVAYPAWRAQARTSARHRHGSTTTAAPTKRRSTTCEQATCCDVPTAARPPPRPHHACVTIDRNGRGNELHAGPIRFSTITRASPSSGRAS